MKKQSKNLLPDGNVVNLKHFIYLDRDRLTSYSSQFSDGIVQLRRLTENIGNRSVDSPVEQYAEEIIEKDNETELSFGPKAHAVGVSVKNLNKNTNKVGFKGGGTAITDESSQSYSQDEIDHDNAYLRLEEKLIKENLLIEVNTINELSQDVRLIKIKGITRFFDWDSLKGLITNFDSLIPLMLLTEQGGIDESQTAMLSVMLNAAKVMIDNFSIGEITVHTHVENSGIITSLNPAYLCMTREQLRATYVMRGDTEVTIVGFSPKRSSENSPFTGMVEMIDHIAPSLWESFVGNVDFVLEPIAIYAETNLK